MDIDSELKALPVFRSLLDGPEWSDACLVSDGLSVGRNLADTPFPHALDNAGAARILGRWETGYRQAFSCPDALSAGSRHRDRWLAAAGGLESSCPPADRQFWRLLQARQTDHWLLLGGLNHLEWQGFAPPGNLAEVYRDARSFIAVLEAGEKLARHPDWGWLGPDPAWLGTGMRLKRVLCLPCLSASPGLPVLEGPLLGRRLSLRHLGTGQASEGVKAAKGPWMVLESRSSLGTSEEGQLDELAESTRVLLHYERAMSVSSDPLQDDRAWRAWGILSNARSLGAGELEELAGHAAWGFIHGSLRTMTGRQQALLFLLTRTGVMDWLVRDREILPDPGYMDQVRAQVVRTVLVRNQGRD